MTLALRLMPALALLTSAFAAPVLAADIDQIIPAPVIEDNYTPVEIGTGWYIRGDVGYNFGGRQSEAFYDLAPITFDDSYKDGLTLGVGAGYRFNDIFRVDSTIDRVLGGSFSNTQLISATQIGVDQDTGLPIFAPLPGPCYGIRLVADPVVGAVMDRRNVENCLRKDESTYDMWYAMGNTYADLATVNGFTPFIGAGLGVARINWTEETNSITCVPADPQVYTEACVATGTVAQPPLNTIYTEPGVINSGSNWKLALSLTAGLSYQLSKGLHVDTAYRFTSIGGGFGSIPYGPTPGSSIAKDGFGLHQVKMGLRYEIW